ncbi:MAG: hypothetical protein NT126_05260 [Bacteroidetes bacterium]|nr:hypothetical protein [Bacteroidota bacterium]
MTTEEGVKILDTIRATMKKHAPPMVVSKNGAEGLELMGNKPVPYGSKKIMVPGMYFCSVIMRKDSVNFYFFPIYFHLDDYKEKCPSILKYLKGKTCFHFKKLEQVNKKELDAMLKTGVQAWKKMGYMK